MSCFPRVAILLATYNGVSHIDSQLASIFSQIGCDFHVFVRDDGSSDGTVDRFFSNNINLYDSDRLTILNAHGIKSGSAASNFFKIAAEVDFFEFDYIAFADQDDVWFPDKLCSAIDLMRASAADGYSSNLLAFDFSRRKSWFLDKLGSYHCELDYFFQGASAGCTYVLARRAMQTVVDSLGVVIYDFPVKYSHDWTVYAICRSHQLSWVHDSRALIAYRQHTSNSFGALPGIRGMIARLRMARSGWYREHILWLSQFLSDVDKNSRVICAVRRLSISDRFFLASNSFSFRRSRLHSLYLSIIILFGFF